MPLQQEPDPRRRWVRQPASLEALCRRAGPEDATPWHARVLNLSLGGAGLASSQPAAPGTVIVIGMFSGGVRLSDLIEARVVHASPHAGGFWLIGCMFLRELTAAEQSHLL